MPGVHIHMISADMLGNATRFALSYLCFANRGRVGSFAVVYVTHNRNYWWTTLEVFQVSAPPHLCYAGFRFWFGGFHSLARLP